MRIRLFSTSQSVVFCAFVFALQATSAWAQEQGRVISATPVTQPVAVQRQVCPVEPAGAAGSACTVQTFTENRAVAFDVVYEYGGRQFSVQMPQDPGPFVQLQISVAPATPATPAAAPVGSTTVISAAPTPIYVTPSPTVVYTTPYPYYWGGPAYAYPPVGVSLRFGYWGGGYRRWR